MSDHRSPSSFLFSGRNVHTFQRSEGWANRREGSERVSVYQTQEQAIEKGREIAAREGVEHLIHGRDGRIRERHSYGNDPHAKKG